MNNMRYLPYGLTTSIMWVDSMAPYGVVNNRGRAVVAVQDPCPNASVTPLTGTTRVDAVVTVGFWEQLQQRVLQITSDSARLSAHRIGQWQPLPGSERRR
ncbi:hypothetical protein OAO87_03730 [bacterium]|nr:hypothetical protein [bacterium]